MTKVVYSIVEHDGGWAYRAGGTFSETFPTRDAARRAAHRAAREQQFSGETAAISWEDEQGRWHEELARGDDRPSAEVQDAVIREAGARPWDRDPHDARIVADVIEGRGRIIDSEQDVGGYPVVTPTRKAFDPAQWNLADMTPR